MRAADVRAGQRVRVRAGAATMGKSLATGDGTVPATVFRVLRNSVVLQIEVPGERHPRELTLSATAGGIIEGLLPA